MNQKKLVLPGTNLGMPALSLHNVPHVSSIRPFGSSILVEMLNADEALGTSLFVKDDSNVGAPQGYVLAFGPNIKAEDVHLRVGDRVLLQGTFVPVPNFDGSKRKKGIVEVHNIKAVFTEEPVVGNN